MKAHAAYPSFIDSSNTDVFIGMVVFIQAVLVTYSHLPAAARAAQEGSRCVFLELIFIHMFFDRSH